MNLGGRANCLCCMLRTLERNRERVDCPLTLISHCFDYCRAVSLPELLFVFVLIFCIGLYNIVAEFFRKFHSIWFILRAAFNGRRTTSVRVTEDEPRVVF